jgi:hypothetical protein
MKSSVYMTAEIYEVVGINVDSVLVLKYTIMIKSTSKIFFKFLLSEIYQNKSKSPRSVEY